MNRLIDRYAVVFVAVAATLWASDAYFRNQLVQHLSPTQIVGAEDGPVPPFLLPGLIRSRGGLRKARPPGRPPLRITGAAALAASGAGCGRCALGSISFWSLTALRFTLALPVLVVVVLVQSGLGGFGHYRMSDFLPNLLAIAIVPGLLALLLYYRALSKTPASLATVAEMAYPVAATLIASAPPPWGFNQPVYPAQLVGTPLLLAVIFLPNRTRERAPSVVVRPVPVA